MLVLPTDRVTAVFVTYGERSRLLVQSVVAAVQAGVDGVVIVSNGCSAETVESIRRGVAPLKADVEIVLLPRNVGSAGGFGVGITTALSRGSWVWLLDDDNAPDSAALTALREAASRAGDGGLIQPLNAWVSYRPSRGYQRRIVEEGWPITAAFPWHGSFMSFHIIQWLLRRVTRTAPRQCTDGLHLPYGPYGGLFVHRTTLEAIGLPDEAMVLYVDDTEYTGRIRRSGGRLTLVPASLVRDMEQNWFDAGATSRGPRRLLEARDLTRLYYSVRNRAYFERNIWASKGVAYFVNRTIYLFYLWSVSRRTSQHSAFSFVLRAVRAGERRALGLEKDYPLSS